jgi:hypothetical protein
MFRHSEASLPREITQQWNPKENTCSQATTGTT